MHHLLQKLQWLGTELKTGPTQGVQPKLKVTPIRKALKNSLRFHPSSVGCSFVFGVVSD